MTETPTLSRETERAAGKEPAKAWKNRWLALRSGTLRCNHCGELQRPPVGGEWAMPHCRHYRTEAEARHSAATKTTTTAFAYLGPIQIEATP